MNYNNPKTQKAAGVIKFTCGLLFVMFSFCYLYFMKGDIIAEAQHSYSNGLTSYSIIVGAILITVVLPLLQWLLSLVVRFPERWYALSYVPSFLALTLITDMDEAVIENFSFGPWIWICPLVLVIYSFIVYAIKRFDALIDEPLQGDAFATMWPNYILLLAMTLTTGAIPDSTDVYQYELTVERLIKEKKWDEATKVAISSYPSSKRLTQLRMYALAHVDSLGEKLFDYPQLYGVEGLLDIHGDDSLHRVSSKDVLVYLGAYADKSVKTSERYLQLLTSRTDSTVRPQAYQYYLCGLLLEKNIDAFRTNINKVYGDTIVSPLPRAYQEALLIGNEEWKVDSVVSVLTAGSIPPYLSLETVQRYHDYYQMKDSIKNKRERINRTRREYGKTYWWYYENL